MQLEDYFEFESHEGRKLIRFKGTRVLLEIVLEDFLNGSPAEEIHQNYRSLSRVQVYAGITYYLQNQARLDEYLAASQKAADDAYAEWQQTHEPSRLELRLRDLRSASTAKAKAAS